MSLDDFASDEDMDEFIERRKELERERPPSNKTRWRDHEPGPENWSQFIIWSTQENNIDDSDKDDIIKMEVDGAPTVFVKSDLWICLKEYA